MQRSTSSTPIQGTIPFFSTNIWGGTSSKSDLNAQTSAQGGSGGSNSRSRPGTSSGDQSKDQSRDQSKDHSRRPSFGRKSSFSSPSKAKRRASSSASHGGGGGGGQIITDATVPPALPDYALSAAAKISKDPDIVASPSSVDSFSKMMSRTMSNPPNGLYQTMSGVSGLSGPSATSPQSTVPILPTETPSIHSHIQDLANKRISTLDYLRKAHEGRIYWFNTLLFDKPDLARMPYFDSRKLARRATNYLLLGLSIPVVIDLNSGTPLEFLRSLNTLLTEFDSYQQIHTENGVNSSSLSRARLPQMFRRPVGKGRRQSGATDLGYADSNGASFNKDGSAVNAAPATVINFGLGGEGNDLLPGEEYTHLLTPNLPFDPDFFETFATLCDVLIDCYSRLMSLLASPKDCTPVIIELFTKADQRVRKIIIQGVVKEFEDYSRTGLKQEIGNVGKVVLGGLM
ncbi:hypothetical protein SAMD00023353_1101560 [Rosellinia necatrix]|uniref:Uncharacterized protein n=1 Tax=Rosellinia necatrix TaxID=77044 RepID=A0A1S7UMP0_ROSNE|nr:hypothetical protein SAMD00023353_1101560 [Rosellinia necatrix]